MALWDPIDAVGPIGREVLEAGQSLVSLLQTPTFAVTELLGTSDSAAWKRHMVRLDFKDVTPIYGSRRGVVTFNKLTSEDWSDYQTEFSVSVPALTADWQYFSGHHAADVHPATIHDDFWEVANNHDTCGFFNEAYHHGTFFGEEEREDSIFLCASKRPASSTLGSSDNPFIIPEASLVRGVIANGCNTFTYRHTRMWLREMFPNAVIIGYFHRTPIGPEAIFPLIGGGGAKGLYQGDPEFWKDPMKRFLGPGGAVDRGKVEEDLRALNAIYYQVTRRRYGINGAKHSLGVMIGDVSYRLVPLDSDRLTKRQTIEKGLIQRRVFDFRW